MIVLGLGSNQGNRLENLRLALVAIKKIPEIAVRHISPVYFSQAALPENAPPEWNKPYLNCALRCDTTLAPEALLQKLQSIENSLGKKMIGRWGPRTIDIDLLAFDDLTLQTSTLSIPHKELLKRPFALWPLADVAPYWRCPIGGSYAGKTAAEIVEKWGSRFEAQAPFATYQINQRIDAPHWVGIINVTPDSFSDGGCFQTAEKAVQQAIHLVNAGAEIIDVGAESTAPSAKRTPAKVEWERLKPVLMALQEAKHWFSLPPKISVDTRHAEVAAKALSMGIDWINDVSGLDDPAMREIVLHSQVDCVVMHHRSIPERRHDILPRHQDPVKWVYAESQKKLDQLEKQGIARERIIFDPGIGFGKMAEQSLLLLKNLHVFSELKTRILIGHSRKTFLSLLTKSPAHERDIETMAMALYLAKKPVNYLRVHDVELCARGLKVLKAMDEN